MAKKGVANFSNQVAKQLIKEQKKKMKELEKQQKEQYINDRHEEASILTNNIDIYIKNLNNIINSKCREISIEEFIKKDLQELKLPEELLVPYTKPSELNIRKSNIIEKLFEGPKQKYNLYVKEEKERYEKEYNIYEENEANRKSKIESLIKVHELQTNEIINSYKAELLNQIEYPVEFKRCINTGYCKDSNKLVIDYLLPDIQIVPDKTGYEYKKTKDEIKAITMSVKDRNSIYNQVVFSIALNSISNVFN